MKPTERGQPANLDAEEGLLACCILDAAVIAEVIDAGFRSDFFFKPAHQFVYEAIRRLHENGVPVDEILVCEQLHRSGLLDAVGGHAEVNRLVNRVESTAHARHWLELVREKAIARKLISTATGIVEKVYSGADLETVLNQAEAGVAGLISATASDDGKKPVSTARARRTAKLLKRAYSRVFDPACPPPEEVPILSLNGQPILHVGNLLAVIAPQKSAKTSSVAAMLASLIGQLGADYLGFSGNNPRNLAVRYYDTEQSRKDFHWMNVRSLRRANREKPAWLTSLSLKSFSPLERQEIIFADIRAAHAAGGILLAVIDGIADLVEDFNDLRETSPFIAELSSLTEDCHCGIVTTLHVNPSTGKEAVKDKARGHLGTILEQKAETILLLSKDKESGVVSLTTKDARHGGLEKPVRFAWSDEHRMHRLVAGDAIPARLEGDLISEAKAAFGAASAMPYSAFRQGLIDRLGLSRTSAERKMKSMFAASVLTRLDNQSLALAENTL